MDTPQLIFYPLTMKQFETLTTIWKFCVDTRLPPTIAQTASALSKSKTATRARIMALKKKGYLTNCRHRRLTLTSQGMEFIRMHPNQQAQIIHGKHFSFDDK